MNARLKLQVRRVSPLAVLKICWHSRLGLRWRVRRLFWGRPRRRGCACARSKVVDAFLGVNADGSVTLFSGKVDLGQGLRISLRQIVAEELGLPIDRIKMVEGDTALTPNQGRTAGSNGIQQGGVQIRQASATARQALTELAAKRARTCRRAI